MENLIFNVIETPVELIHYVGALGVFVAEYSSMLECAVQAAIETKLKPTGDFVCEFLT